ncbi:CAP-associated domain-containing protein [Vagococcus carniphilus]|uniref:CAP-associated domain-containing protein n=1 Tax=Vagococcus carniphilus TaxID=218144 RepID=A0AAW8TZA6_9ENTE|nr:CAP-associated domain-containing protein [Vagococcus carniphilus]MDT2832638.1 CAP-associated domain-containing protein [Vagococcus carniphilus]
MKRSIEFIVCLFLVLSVVYMKPVISSRNQPKPKNDLSVEKVKISHKSVPYYELNTTGMANYVGKTKDEFLKEFPKPKKTLSSYYQTEWLVYGDSLNDYYQVEIKNSVVSSIFVLGKDVETPPFAMDMNLVDLAEITTIFSNFNFSYGDEKYEVELTEDDMNYRPLVAFNNGTFAMLHINQGTGKLMAVRYLDKHTLLSIMPYQMDQDNKVQEKLPLEAKDWHQVNQDNQEQLVTILNLLREKEDKKKYQMDSTLQVGSKKGIELLSDKPDVIIDEESHLKNWKKVSETNISTSPFVLNKKETIRLIKKIDLSPKETHGIFYAPVVDVPFMVTNWYGSRFYHEELAHKNDSRIGLTFDKQGVMTFFGKEKEKIKTVESSDNGDL